jgi:class 3 adenylate cyclase
MEAHGVGGQIQITRATYELIKEDFLCESRGMVDVKGKGEMEVWHVKGMRARIPALCDDSPTASNLVPERERPTGLQPDLRG